MTTSTFVAGALRSPWEEALERLPALQRMPDGMPAMLLALLDLLEEEGADLPFVPFAPLERRFSERMARLGLEGGDQAWLPFFHLSAEDGLWELFRRNRPADFSDLKTGRDDGQPRPRNRAGLVRRADRARLREELIPQIATLQGRSVLRARLMETMEQRRGGK